MKKSRGLLAVGAAGFALSAAAVGAVALSKTGESSAAPLRPQGAVAALRSGAVDAGWSRHATRPRHSGPGCSGAATTSTKKTSSARHPSHPPAAVPDTPAASSPPADPADPPAQTGAMGGEVTAAARYGWAGKLLHSDDFTGSRLDPSWEVYDSAGHAGNGRRSPGAISVGNGVLRITGTPDGTTGGMAWKYAQTYGRWEARVRLPAGCGCYHPVLILWPTGNNGTFADGELDYLEVVNDPARQNPNFFLHQGGRQLEAHKRLDMTTWHTYAVEVAPDHVTGYIDGQPWFHATSGSAIPRQLKHQTIQLDWFPGEGAGRGATMEVDWVKMYGL